MTSPVKISRIRLRGCSAVKHCRNAKVAELVDALASGVSVLTDVRVQVPLFAPILSPSVVLPHYPVFSLSPCANRAVRITLLPLYGFGSFHWTHAFINRASLRDDDFRRPPCFLVAVAVIRVFSAPVSLQAASVHRNRRQHARQRNAGRQQDIATQPMMDQHDQR